MGKVAPGRARMVEPRPGRVRVGDAKLVR